MGEAVGEDGSEDEDEDEGWSGRGNPETVYVLPLPRHGRTYVAGRFHPANAVNAG